MFTYTFISVCKKHLSDHMNLDKTSSTIKHGICNSTPSKNGNGDLWENWALIKLTWENYVAVTDIEKKAANVLVGTLLVISKECLQIYKNLLMSAEERADTQNFLERLTNYFEPKQNIVYQWYMFNSRTQEQGEKFDAYLIKLKHLIKMCKYSALEDELLRDRILTSTSNNNVWARLLSESGLTLDQAIDICRSTEQTE